MWHVTQAAQSLEVQLAALAAWETYIFGRLKTFKVPTEQLRALLKVQVE